MEKNNKKIRALCLSGGGTKGAYAGGMLQYMKQEMRKDYDMYLGTSTGSLLQTLTSIDDFEGLKEGYTSMNINDIYGISPFKKVKDPNKSSQVGLNIWSVIKMHFFKKEPTFGDNTKFIEVIKRFFPYDKYCEAYDKGVNLTAVVTNLSKVRTEYYSIQQLGRSKQAYESFVDWTWISTCATPFTSVARRVVSEEGLIFHKGKDDVMYSDYYGDGGFTEHMPISKAIEDGATEIDAISTTTIDYSGDLEPEFGANPLTLLGRLFDISMREAMERDIDRALNMAKEKSVILNIYHFPRKITDNSMYFDKKQMTGWWDEGYEHMKEHHLNKEVCCKVIKMKARKTKKK